MRAQDEEFFGLRVFGFSEREGTNGSKVEGVS